MFFWGELWRLVVMDIVFSGRVVKEFCLGDEVYFGGCCLGIDYMLCVEVSFMVFILSGPPIYDVFSLYSLNHRSMFVLDRDLIFKQNLLLKKNK